MLKIEASRPNLYNKKQNTYSANHIQVANKAIPTFCAKEKAGNTVKNTLIKLFNIITCRDLIIEFRALKKDVKNLRNEAADKANELKIHNEELTELIKNNEELGKIKEAILGTNKPNSTTHKFN